MILTRALPGDANQDGTVKIEVENPLRELKLNMPAEAEILLGDKN